MIEKVIRSEINYKGKILNLKISDVELENGNISKREIIEHRGAVAVAAITDENEILMVRQYRVAVEKALLEIPAGLIEEGEDPESTAIRELEEETGYIAGKIKKIHTYYTSPGFTDEQVHIYLATELSHGMMNLDEGENLVVEKYSVSDISKLLRESVDSKTIIALLYLLKEFI